MTEAKKQTAPQKSPIRALLSRPVAFHPVLARLCGSVTAGLMLSQAIYWSERTEDPDGWFWKTLDDWTNEICLSRDEQEGARAQLSGLGFMETCRRGVGAKLHFRVNFEKLEEAIRKNAEIPHSRMRKSRILKCGNSSFRKTRNPECGNPAFQSEEKPQSEMRNSRIPSLLDSLTTAETTSETTSNSDSGLAEITRAMAPWGVVSNAAVAGMFTVCRSKAKDATVEEVVEFIRQKGDSIGENIRNPIGLLLATVPACFEGESLTLCRKEIERRRSVRTIACHWCGYEYSTDGEQGCPSCRAAPNAYGGNVQVEANDKAQEATA